MFEDEWNKRFLRMALYVQTWSKDDSTKVAAIIVDSNKIVRATGYNGIPRLLDDNNRLRHERPEKYKWFSHAEENLFCNCARLGVSTNDCTIFITACPCNTCTRMIIQSGITNVVFLENKEFETRWADAIKTTKEMLEEASIPITKYEYEQLYENQ
jgi:dCMP deaminase